MRKAVGAMRKSSMPLARTGTYGCCHDRGWKKDQEDFWGWDLIKVVLTSCVIEHYCGLCRYFQMTCKKSNKLSATSVSLAQSAENNTTRCSCRRQDSTYRDRDREMASERHMKVNVSLLLFYSN